MNWGSSLPSTIGNRKCRRIRHTHTFTHTYKYSFLQSNLDSITRPKTSPTPIPFPTADEPDFFLQDPKLLSPFYLLYLYLVCVSVFFFYYYAKRKFPSRVSCPVRGGASRKLRSCLSPLSVAFWSDATP